MEKICKGCGIGERAKKFKSKGKHTLSWCYACYNKQHGGSRRDQKDRRIQRLREFLCSYLISHHCVDCKESDWVVLQFDHRDPSTKLFEVPKAASTDTIGMSKLQEEIAKCDIVCANCHTRRTQRMFGSWRLSFQAAIDASQVD